jgi:two-component system sporulation sensor kinase B
MSAIHFTPFFPAKIKTLLTFILMLPVVFSAYYFKLFPIAEFELYAMRLWVGLYFLTACLLLLVSYLKEHNLFMRRNRLRMTIVFAALLAWTYATEYASKDKIIISESKLSVIANPYWVYNNIFFTLLISVIVYFAIKYGFLGIKLRIERQSFEQTMKALTQGTDILNHTLKNEIQKMKYLQSRAKDYVTEGKKEEAILTIDSLQSLSDHLLEMVFRLKDKTNNFILKEDVHILSDLINFSLRSLQPIMEQKKIVVEKDTLIDIKLLCDGLHLREAFNNLLLNAIDAIPTDQGRISIRIFDYGKGIVIEIEDNGSGISKENLSRVFEPFFTTKRSTSHFGLGLTYCFNVIQKHGGSLNIAQSGLDKGTIISMKFPKSKVIKSEAVLPVRGDVSL